MSNSSAETRCGDTLALRGIVDSATKEHQDDYFESRYCIPTAEGYCCYVVAEMVEFRFAEWLRSAR